MLVRVLAPITIFDEVETVTVMVDGMVVMLVSSMYAIPAKRFRFPCCTCTAVVRESEPYVTELSIGSVAEVDSALTPTTSTLSVPGSNE